MDKFMINRQTESRGKSTKVSQSENGGGRGMMPAGSRDGDGKSKGRKPEQTTAGTGSSSLRALKHEEIAARAHQIYLKKGKPEGRDLENWLEAEKELRAEKR